MRCKFDEYDLDPRIVMIEEARNSLLFVVDQMFQPSVICGDRGKTCGRIEDTLRLLSRNLDRENQLMIEADYPGFAAHNREHEKLLHNLDNMRLTLACSQYDNTFLFKLLTEWSNGHTAKFDGPFVDFLRRPAAARNQGN